MLEIYINKDLVIRKLISYRCKIAENVSKKESIYSLVNEKFSQPSKNKNIEFIYSLFPPRSKWATISYNKRRNLNQVERNKLALLYTVRKMEQLDIKEDWFRRLSEYSESIVRKGLCKSYKFEKPNVSAIVKNSKSNPIECRPVCNFKLDDKLILSLYNKCLTNLFDKYFYKDSYAFRVPVGNPTKLAHLNAVSRIKEFRKKNPGTLFVAEYDMKKFYDTIDHSIIKQRFCQLLRKPKQEGIINLEEYRKLKSIMYSYIDCFNFYNDIYKYQDQQNHPIWKGIKDSSGKKKVIEWIESDIQSHQNKIKYPTITYYKHFLGVPQGGALSGLIANIIMHKIDMKLKKYWENNPEFCYIRFCDDMIMIGKNKEFVNKAFDEYSVCLEDTKLYRHNPGNNKSLRARDFWEGKTKKTYKWGVEDKESARWITFVGYDYNWEGDTRIRKKSLEKEKKKQYEKYNEIVSLFSKKINGEGVTSKWSPGFLINSLVRRLIGMSVGRVPIWDYKNYDNQYCWASAFTELTDNRWSRKQLKQLDHTREKNISRIRKFVKSGIKYDIKGNEFNHGKKLTFDYYGKPFSYYGQCLKIW